MNAQLPNAAELSRLPLTDDAKLLERVTAIVGPASRRQVWILMLDERRCQLPSIVPVDLPRRADTDPAEAFAPLLSGILAMDEVAHLVLAYERPGPATPDRDDRDWLTGFAGAIERADGSVLGLFFATNAGVRHWELPRDSDDHEGEQIPAA